MNLHFQKATIAHQKIIFEWLDKPHIQKFWDNSQEHKDDVLNFMNGRKKPSSYFDGIFKYWVGYYEQNPFCFILTSEILLGQENPNLWNEYLSKTGKTYSLDFGIGNEAFLGRGLAAPTLEAFCKFFKVEVEPKTDMFFIDPDENNFRAKHVYEKAGFKFVGSFNTQNGHKTCLMVKPV